jgi:hypothetical protein
MIRRRAFVTMIGGAAVAGSRIMQSQGADKRPLIAVLGTTPPNPSLGPNPGCIRNASKPISRTSDSGY